MLYVVHLIVLFIYEVGNHGRIEILRISSPMHLLYQHSHQAMHRWKDASIHPVVDGMKIYCSVSLCINAMQDALGIMRTTGLGSINLPWD